MNGLNKTDCEPFGYIQSYIITITTNMLVFIIFFFSTLETTSQTPPHNLNHSSDFISGLRLPNRVSTITTDHNPTIDYELLKGAITTDTYQTLMTSGNAGASLMSENV
jgi:hypothetical protein